MKKIIMLLLTLSSLNVFALGQTMTENQYYFCSPIGTSINPSFSVEKPNGASFRAVRNNQSNILVSALTDYELSDTAVYDLSLFKDPNALELSIKTLFIVQPDCAGVPATLTGVNGQSPYCCTN